MKNLQKRVQIPELISIASKTFNLTYDENEAVSSKERITELCQHLNGVKAEYFNECVDQILQGFDIFKENLKARREKNENLSERNITSNSA